jgi:hypothetical protein
MLDKTTEIKITDGVIDDSVPIQYFENYLKNALQIDIVLGLVQGITDSLLNKKKVTVQDIQHILERLTWLRDVPDHGHSLDDLDLSKLDYVSSEELKALGYLTNKEVKNIILEETKLLKLEVLKSLPEKTQQQISKLNQDLDIKLSQLNKTKDIEELKRQISVIQDDCSSLIRNIRDLGSNNNKIDLKEIEKNILKKVAEEFTKNEPEGEKQRYYRIFKVFTQNYDGLVPKPTEADIAANKVLRADGTWATGGGGGGGTVNSVVAGENITVDNSDTTNPIVASSGQSDPYLTIIGTGVANDEFKYNEDVVVVSGSPVFLDNKSIYKTYTTDGSTDFDFDYSGITLDDFTFKVFVHNRNPARITIPVLNDLWIGGYQYVSQISSTEKGASLTVRFKSNRTNITNICGNWEGF